MIRTALLALALVSAVTTADARHVLAMARVEAGDLDLGSDAGAAAMIRRLDAAARSLCAGIPYPLLPGHDGRAWRCRKDAMASAVERLRAPRLIAAHQAWLSAGPDADPQARNPG